MRLILFYIAILWSGTIYGTESCDTLFRLYSMGGFFEQWDKSLNVVYVSDTDLPKYKVHFNDGLAKDFKGEPVTIRDGVYVMSPDGDLYIGMDVSGKFHHSSLLRGADVGAAGRIWIDHGHIKVMDTDSGHYAPEMGAFDLVRYYLERAGIDPDSVSFRDYDWRLAP
jgi:hypothetical protein